MNILSDSLGRLLRLAVRLALVAAGAVFFFSLLLAGALGALGFTLWSLVRGRRPVLADIWQVQRAMRARAQDAGLRDPWRRPTAAASAREDIVEVQAREVVPANKRMTRG
jgi:hypothetical protein